MYIAWNIRHNKQLPFANHTKSPYSREHRIKTAFQQQFDVMASDIIHEAIQPTGDVLSVVKNQNMFAQNVMSHFILIVLKTVTNLCKEHWMSVIDNAFLMSGSVVLKIFLTIPFPWFCSLIIFLDLFCFRVQIIVSTISQIYIWSDHYHKNDTHLL